MIEGESSRFQPDIDKASPADTDWVRIKLDIGGDDSLIGLPGDKYERLKQLAESREVNVKKLLRAGIHRYGYEDFVDKLLLESTDDPTIPGPEHEGHVRFSINYDGDVSFFSLPEDRFEQLRDLEAKTKLGYKTLVRNAIRKYGFDEAIDKLLAEGSGTEGEDQ